MKIGYIRSAWVLGANSDVAVSICKELAKKGCRKFFLISRNNIKIKKIANYLRGTYKAEVDLKILDLTDFDTLDNPSFYEVNDFDLYLITAGYLGNNDLAMNNVHEAKKILDSNFVGIVPWINAIISPERIKRKGCLWVFTSVASDRGRPSNYYYGSAKAGLQNFCEGLIARCHGKQFSVRIIKAGYMATQMTIGKVPDFLCIKTSDVARILLRKPFKNGVEYLPWYWNPIMSLIKIFPNSLISKL